MTAGPCGSLGYVIVGRRNVASIWMPYYSGGGTPEVSPDSSCLGGETAVGAAARVCVWVFGNAFRFFKNFYFCFVGVYRSQVVYNTV